MSTDGKSQTPQTPEQERIRRRRLRTLIIGSLAAGGAFQLNGWQVQAHGNRSSHSVASLRTSIFRPEDYILMRQDLTMPNASDTLALSLITGRLDTELSRGASPANARRVQALINNKADLEDRLRFRTSSKRALDFLHSGDIDAAAAVIEGEGQPETVLNEYLWALLDVAYDARRDKEGMDKKEVAAAATSEDFNKLAGRAYAYATGVLSGLPAGEPNSRDAGLRLQVAEIYHNIAAFSVPERGPVPDYARELGRKAALDSLALRQQMNQLTETMIANWMAGRYFEASGDVQSAEKYYRTSVMQAEALKDPAGSAWGKASLASLMRVKNKGKAGAQVAFTELNAEIDADLASTDDSSALIQLLKLDRSADR